MLAAASSVEAGCPLSLQEDLPVTPPSAQEAWGRGRARGQRGREARVGAGARSRDGAGQVADHWR